MCNKIRVISLPFTEPIIFLIASFVKLKEINFYLELVATEEIA
jgi:hypothetical protein